MLLRRVDIQLLHQMIVGAVQHMQHEAAILHYYQQDIFAVAALLQQRHTLRLDIQRIYQTAFRRCGQIARIVTAGVCLLHRTNGHIPQSEALRRPIRPGLHIRRETRRHQYMVAAVDAIGREAVLHIEASDPYGIHLGRAVAVPADIKGQLRKVVLPHRDTQLIEGQLRRIIRGKAT